MSLRDRANQVLDGFDAKNDKINGYEGLPEGEYLMVVEKVSRSNFDQLAVIAQVLEGDHTGQNEFINLGLDEVTKAGKPLPDFVIDRSIKTVATLGAVLGVAISDEAWDDMGILVDAFKAAEGKQFMMTLKLRENKKRPEYPYKEYEFEEVKEDPFTQETPEIKDEDLPFGNNPDNGEPEAPVDENSELPF